MLVAEELGCRVILHIHGAKFDEFFAGEPVWRQRLIAWSMARADSVIALSCGWRDKLKDMAPRARLVVVENAVAQASIRPEKRRDGTCRFVLLARMDEWKGIDDLLDACCRLRHGRAAVHVTLAGPSGTAGDAAELAGKIRARGLDQIVRYVGELRGDAKANLLGEADVYVQPSHHEGMPISVLEALAQGLPVVATHVGAIPEVITDGQEGLLVPPRRPELLAKAMKELAVSGQQRSAMSQAARSLAAERFSIERLRNDLLCVYEEVEG
jgi:glycosyltransferase involved in cell wall biosynthesis